MKQKFNYSKKRKNPKDQVYPKYPSKLKLIQNFTMQKHIKGKSRDYQDDKRFFRN